MVEEIFADEDSPLFGMEFFSRDPLFQNITNVFPLQSNTVLSFDNSMSTKAVDGGEVLLSRQAFVSEQDAASFDDVAKKKRYPAPGNKLLPDAFVHIDCRKVLEHEGGVPEYILPFRRQETQWRYCIVQKYSQPGMFAVKDIGGNQSFLPAEPMVLADGTPALAVLSEKPIGLYERPAVHFQLLRQGKHAESVVVKRLSAPRPDFFKEGNASKISEVIVYC